MPNTAFFEIILPVFDEGGWGCFLDRCDVEDALDEALSNAGVGEVTGAGTGLDSCIIDVDATDFDRAIPIIRRVLQELRVPENSKISRNEGNFLVGAGKRTYYTVYD